MSTYFPQLEAQLDDYIDGYEFEGDNGAYAPNETEREALSEGAMKLLQDVARANLGGPDSPQPAGPTRKDHMRAFVAEANALAPTAQPQAEPNAADFCWLVELFEPAGNSMGRYHTGFTTLMPGESRATGNPYEAKRYSTKAMAQTAADKLLHLAGVWRAVEHAFTTPTAQPQAAEPTTLSMHAATLICNEQRASLHLVRAVEAAVRRATLATPTAPTEPT